METQLADQNVDIGTAGALQCSSTDVSNEWCSTFYDSIKLIKPKPAVTGQNIWIVPLLKNHSVTLNYLDSGSNLREKNLMDNFFKAPGYMTTQ